MRRVWNKRQSSRIQMVKFIYLRNTCGVRKKDVESNECV